MDERVNYSDCELIYIDQGYDLSRASELCASEDRGSEGEGGESSRDEDRDEFGGDDF